MRKRLSVIFVSLAILVMAFAPMALAWQAEGGTKNCGSFVGYVHARYNDVAALQGPGGTSKSYLPNDGLWHVQERNGGYSGEWAALGDPLLDLANTWAGCRNYG